MQPGSPPASGGGSSGPAEGSLAWDRSQQLLRSWGQHISKLPELVRAVHTMNSTLDATKAAFERARGERDETLAALQTAHHRLQEVHRMVQRYAQVQDPVVVSDGFTYERSTIERYMDDCRAAENCAYSQQTMRELSAVLFPNRSLKKLVDMLQAIKPLEAIADVPPSPAASTEGSTLTALQPRIPKSPQGLGAEEELNPGLGTVGTIAQGPAGLGSVPECHPCLRVYGFCIFKDECAFARFPYFACLNYIKGKCRFGDACKEPHFEPNDPLYQNRGGNGSRDLGVGAKNRHRRGRAGGSSGQGL